MRIATCLLLLLALTAPAAAGTRAGVTMPDRITVAHKNLSLNGMGLREATFLKIDVYVAGLYVERVSSDPNRLIWANETKRLVLYFVRDVKRSDITKAWNQGFKGNSTVSPASIQGQIDQLNRWMPAFKKRDTLIFTFVPGQGVTVDINGTRKGILKGEDFARSLLAIWLGPRPPTGSLKRGLLGRH